MKINKLSALGGIAGSILTLGSFIRYFIMYPDLDRLIIYVCVGFLIVAVSYLWDRLVQTNIKVEALQEYVAANSKEVGKTYG